MSPLEPTTTTLGLAALVSFLKAIPAQAAYEVIGGEAHDKFRQLMTRLGGHLSAGDLPANEHLERAVRASLSAAALVFAYTFHDPNRKLLGELVRHGSWSSAKRLGHQLAELVRGNIFPETPQDEWIAALIERARDPNNFADFVTLCW